MSQGKKCITENCTIVIGLVAASIMLGSMIHEASGKVEEPEYIVIESDYDGTILLDPETGVRYLETGEGIYELERTSWTD